MARRSSAASRRPPARTSKVKPAVKAGRKATRTPAVGARRSTPSDPDGAPLGVGLIGARFMGRAHSNAWSQAGKFFELPRPVELAVIAARDAGALAPFAKQWGWARHTTRWQDLVQDPAVALVDIGTPNDVHREQAIAALEAGKHVACEKPLAGTLDDARAMRDAARKASRRGGKAGGKRGGKAGAGAPRTFVWFNYRRCPAIGLAWQLIREGRLGAIRHVRAHYLQSWGGPDTPRVWRFQKSRAGSGAHGDLNAHIVDLARFLTGDEITEVHGAVTRTFIKERTLPEGGGGTRKGQGAGRSGKGPRKGRSDVDDAALFLASFAGGAVASFEASRVAPGHLNRNVIEVNGELGSLRFDFEEMNDLHFHDEAVGERTGGWRRIVATSAAGGHPYAGQWWPDAHGLGYEHGFVNMAADIVRELGGTEPELPLPDFEDAWKTQAVLEAALIAAREGHAVKLSEVR